MHSSDPLYGQQWHLAAIGDIETIWDEYSGAGIHVGVYDSGVELDHPDLAGNYDAGREVLIDGTTLRQPCGPSR
jgi:subtilisin family serine protease